MPAAERPGTDARYLTIRQTSILLQLHEMTIRSMVNKKTLPACRFGRAIRIDVRKLEAQLEAQMAKAAAR